MDSNPTVQNEQTFVAQMMQIERRSILPPPAELEKYEKLRPGITDVLLTSFQEQAHHRMELEKAVIKSGIANSMRGQIFAFLIA
mgnify:CR=1 FL=1